MIRLLTPMLVFAFCAATYFAAASPATKGHRIPADSVAVEKAIETEDVSNNTENADISAEDPDPPFLFAEQMPTFQGADPGQFRLALIKALRYPPEAIERELEGDVIISFVVERDGTISNIEELLSPDPLLSNEVIRTLIDNQEWEPGYNNGEPVRVKLTMPLKFELTDEVRAHQRSKVYYADDVHTPPKMGDLEFAEVPAWLAANIDYVPEEADKDVICKVEIRVNREGVMRFLTWGSPLSGMDEAIKAALDNAAVWTPAMRFGKPVNFSCDFSLRFTPDGKVTSELCDPEEALTEAQVMPKFRGGELSVFRRWVMERVKYPQEARQRNISGTVVVSFIINKDGSLSDIVTLRSPDVLLTQEVKRVVGSSPTWEPGLHKDRPVRVKFNLPVQFVIQ